MLHMESISRPWYYLRHKWSRELSLLLPSCPSLIAASQVIQLLLWLPAIYTLTSAPGEVSQRKSDVCQNVAVVIHLTQKETAVLETAQGPPQPSKGLCPSTSNLLTILPAPQWTPQAPEPQSTCPGVAHSLHHPHRGNTVCPFSP